MKIPQTLEQMLAELKGRVLSPERKEVVAQIATDLIQLNTRALAGEDVSAELQHVKSQSASLAASEVELVRNSVLGWVSLITGAIVRGAIAGL